MFAESALLKYSSLVNYTAYMYLVRDTLNGRRYIETSTKLNFMQQPTNIKKEEK